MSGLAPTPPDRLLDDARRPYFLWDVDVTVDDFRRRLDDPDPEISSHWLAKLLRQAKPDDVFTFVTRRRIEALWPQVERRLGRSREFWSWILARWREIEEAR
jgi:hypothetical protein